jgi:hypothetical protein
MPPAPDGELVTTQEQLDEAIAARHALLIGKARVSVGFGDRRVEYAKADLAKLDAYIAQLRATIVGKPRVRNRIRYMAPY